MTYTKQPLGVTITCSKKDTEKPDPRTVLLDSFLKLEAELIDFAKVAEKYFEDMETNREKGEIK